MAFDPEARGIRVRLTDREEGEGMHEARDKTRELMDEARERTSDVVSRAGERARSEFENQKSRAAQSLSTVASVLRESGQQLRDRDEAAVAPVVDRVADGVDRLSNFLNSRNVDDMMRDVQQFARRRPEVFLGAFFTLGVLAARFMKAGQREPGYDRHGYTYVHGTAGARLPDIRDVSRGTGTMGYDQSRGYSEGAAFAETGGPSVPYQPSRGYSAGAGTEGGTQIGEEAEREPSRETGTSERERSDRESNRFER